MASVSEWLAELAETEIAEADEAPNGERLLLKSLLESAIVMDESVKKKYTSLTLREVAAEMASKYDEIHAPSQLGTQTYQMSLMKKKLQDSGGPNVFPPW